MMKVTVGIPAALYAELAATLADLLPESDCHPYVKGGRGLDLTGLIVIPQIGRPAHHAQLDLFIGHTPVAGVRNPAIEQDHGQPERH